jgi:adenine-specific DNA-methyltransferase
MDEIFGSENFVSLISFRTTSGFASAALSRAGDYLCWHCKDKGVLKYRPLYRKKEIGVSGTDYTRMWSCETEQFVLFLVKNHRIPS